MPQPRKKQASPSDGLGQEIALHLKEARLKRGFTQAELADRVGVTREAIAAYETGRVRLLDDIIIRYATALGVSTDEILGVTSKSTDVPVLSLRLMKRLQKIERLPAFDQKALLKTIDNALKGAGITPNE
jgi:transcriptional regulator with XRE-family HTH domain